MLNLNNIRLKPKLLALFLTIGIIPLSLLGWWSSESARHALNKQVSAQLEAVRDIKKAQITRYFQERVGDVQALAKVYSKAVEQAFDNLSAIHALKKQALSDYLQQHQANTQILASTPCVSALLKQTTEKSSNNTGWLRQNLPLMGYTQVIIADTQGKVAFSLAADAPANILQADAQYTALRESFLAGLKALHRQDFQPYGAAQEQLAFISAPIPGLGVLILALPNAPLNAIMQAREGMKTSGESYLVAQVEQRFMLRSALASAGNAALVIGSEITDLRQPYVQQAFSGISVRETYIEASGKPILVRADALALQGLNWAIVSKIDLEEAALKNQQGEDIFAAYAKLYGYHDIFLITKQGFVFHSIAKEKDYQSNLQDGIYKETHLGDLFRRVLQEKHTDFADFKPYAPSGGQAAFFAAHPVLNAEQAVDAVIAVQLFLEGINHIMQTRSGMGNSGETYLVGNDYRMRSDSFLDATQRSVQASFAGTLKDNGVQTLAAQQALAGQTRTQEIQDYRNQTVLSAFTPIEAQSIHWALLAEVDLAEVQAPVTQLNRLIFTVLLSLVGIITLLGWWLANSLSHPLRQAVNVARSLGEGDLGVSIVAQGKDEIGEMLTALQHMLEKLVDIIRQTRNSINSLASTSEEISASAQSLSQTASEQAASVEETTSTLEVITATVNENASNAQNTQAIAERVRTTAETGGSALLETVEAMQAIAKKIRSVEEIAYKTNLLALNAAIEAARAGEHGRGFAVVASEVQKLAQSSRLAAQDINQLVGDSVQVSQRAGALLKNILPEIHDIAQQTRAVALASQQQRESVEQINSAIAQLDTVSQQNASSAEQLAAAAEEMSAQAARLAQIIEFFKLHGER